jgi:hypothetical protein
MPLRKLFCKIYLVITEIKETDLFYLGQYKMYSGFLRLNRLAHIIKE